MELSHFQTGLEGDNGLNYITTSHTVGEEFGGGALINNQLKYGYSVRNVIHNHPSNRLNASSKDLQARDKILKIEAFKNSNFLYM